jgi:hypothetical protein
LNKRRVLWTIAGAGVLALAAWALFHPDYHPDPQVIAPAVRAELAKTGFKATQGVRAARYAQVAVLAGQRQESDMRQEMTPVDALLTERRTRRYAKGNRIGVQEEYASLTVGPLVVARYWRSLPLAIGDFLPYHFWSMSRMSELTVEENAGFPHTAGARLAARIAYDFRHADGVVEPPEHGRLACEVEAVVEARVLADPLPGLAARVHCKEVLERTGTSEFTHWYVIDRGWSVPLEGYVPVAFGNEKLVRNWTSRLLSYE